MTAFSFNRPFRAVCLLLFLGTLVSNGAIAQDEKGTPIAFRVICLDHADGIQKVKIPPLWLDGISIPKPTPGSPRVSLADGDLVLSRANLSTAWLRARVVDGKLPFYDAAKPLPVEGVPPVEGAVPPKLVALVQFPNPIPPQSYLVFVPDRDPEARIAYRVAVIDARKQAFPAGSHYIYNLSSRGLRGIIGGSTFTLDSGQRDLVRVGTERTKEGYLPVEMQYRSGEDWKRLTLTRWQEDKGAQRLCLAFDGRKRIEIRTIQQYVAPVGADKIEPEGPSEKPEGLQLD